MKKRFISFMLIMILIIGSMAGCGSASGTTESEVTEEPTVEVSQSPSAAGSFTQGTGGEAGEGITFNDSEKNLTADGIEVMKSDVSNELNKELENNECDAEAGPCGSSSIPKDYELNMIEVFQKNSCLESLCDRFYKELNERSFEIFKYYEKKNTNFVFSNYAVLNSMAFMLQGSADSELNKTRFTISKWFEGGNNDLPNYILVGYNELDRKFIAQNELKFNGLIGSICKFRGKYNSTNIMNTMNVKIDDDDDNLNNYLNEYFGDLTAHTLFQNEYSVDNTYLASIGYFEELWETPVSEYIAFCFNNGDGTISDAYYMNFNEEMSTVHGNGIKGIVKPFSYNHYSIMFLQPDKVKFSDMVSSLNGDVYSELIASMQTEFVDAYIPKFTASSEIELADYLKDNGCESIFYDTAQYYTYTADPMKLNDIMHMSYFSLNGRGAKSYDSIATANHNISEHEGTIMKFDSPFVYIIFDNDTKVPVMIGDFTSLEQNN